MMVRAHRCQAVYSRHRDVLPGGLTDRPGFGLTPRPFLVVHGTADTVIPAAQAQAFVEKMRSTSLCAVGYLELPGAHHGLDMTDGSRTGTAATVIGLFLNELHRSRVLSRTKEAK